MVTLLVLNAAGTVYSQKPEFLPTVRVENVAELTEREQPGGEYAGTDTTSYHVLSVAEGERPGIPQGKYLVNDQGRIRYLVDPAINGRLKERDDGTPVANKFEAPKTRLMALIIDGILNQKLPWGLVLIGVLTAITLELAGVPSLPFAVGVYLPIQTSVPIFIGGALRFAVDRIKRQSAAEAEMSPGVLLSSGFIAGGSIAGVVIAICSFVPQFKAVDLTERLSPEWVASNWPSVVAFAGLALVLVLVGLGKLLGSGIAPEPARKKR